jgi:hypothetical protein
MQYRLDQSFSEHGVFWLPEHATEEVEGELAYTPATGLDLTLARRFKVAPGASPLTASWASSYPVIHGTLVSGQSITLLNSFVIRQQFGAGAEGPSNIRVNACIVGAHLSDPKDTSIEAVKITTESMTSWACAQPFTTKKGLELGVLFTVDAHGLPVVKVPLSAPHKHLELLHAVGSKAGLNHVTLTHEASWQLCLESPVDLSSAKQLAWQMQNLVSVLVGKAEAVTSCQFRLAQRANVQARPDRTADIVYSRTNTGSVNEKFPFEMILPYSECNAHFCTIVQHWFPLVTRCSAALNIFFSTLHQPPPVQELRFLSFTQALESYHRSVGEGLYMAQPDYDALLPPMEAAIPPVIRGDHRQSLINRLRYGNEYSLRKRLTLLLRNLPPEIQRLISSEPTRFIEKVVASRNYFTHYDDASRARAFTGADIFHASEVLAVMFIAVLLSALHVPSDVLVAIFSEDERIRDTLSRLLL